MDLKPCYKFGEPNESVLLASNKPCTFHSDRGEANGQADLRLDFLPRSRVKIDVEYQTDAFANVYSGFLNVARISMNGQEFPVLSTNVTLSFLSQSSSMTLIPRREPMLWVGDGKTKMSKVVFHLFNYKDTFGTSRSVRPSGDMIVAYPETKLESAEWTAELHNCETENAIKKLRKIGGYGLTHVGCFYKTDGALFDGETAKKMIEHLHYFFTFSKGTFCSPVLPVGFDEDGQRVWELLNSPREPWSAPPSWFDSHHCEQLAHLFPGFIAKLEDEIWRDTLQKVLYWYARSSDPVGSGIDAGIILTQIAIERLAFEYAVNHEKMIEAEGFKKLKASDKLRLLFASLGIPMEIPSTLSKMHQAANRLQYDDAPHALTVIRNSLVHPEHKHENEFRDVYREAWSLGLWYLELAILRICHYNGTYFNRLSDNQWVGNVEDVPWRNSGCDV